MNVIEPTDGYDAADAADEAAAAAADAVADEDADSDADADVFCTPAVSRSSAAAAIRGIAVLTLYLAVRKSFLFFRMMKNLEKNLVP
jgi:hypothetical protein